jgi:predicted aspartyl protease
VGTFSIEVEIRPRAAPPDGWTQVKCLVDTGAAFSQFPEPLLGRLGIAADRQVPVVLADGTLREQPAAWIEVRYGALTAFTLVLFAGANGLTLLGAHALEGLGLVVDPVRKALEPGRFPLA